MNTILHLLQKGEQVSLVRFNDGEIGAILGDLTRTSRGKQEVTPSLVEKLNFALDYRAKNYFIGFPCPICYPKYYSYTRERLGDYEHQILSVCTTNNHYNLFKSEILKVLEGKRVLYVAANTAKPFGWIYKRIPGENSESFDLDFTEDLEKYDVFLFAIGSVSRYWVAKLHQLGKSALDIGSLFDPETRNVFLKPHKWISKYKNEQKYCPICNY